MGHTKQNAQNAIKIRPGCTPNAVSRYRRQVFLVTGLLFLLIAIVALPAIGNRQPPVKKVLLLRATTLHSNHSWTAAETLLVEELLNLNFDVEEQLIQPRSAEATYQQMREIAGTADADVLVWVGEYSPGAQKAILLFASATETRLLWKTVPLQYENTQAAAAAAGLRIVETIRSGLHDPIVPTATKPALPSFPPSPATSVAASLGTALIGNPSDIGPMIGLLFNVTVTLPGPVGIGLEGIQTVWAKEITQGERRSSFHMFVLRSDLLWNFYPSRRWRPSFGLSGGWLLAWAEGTHTPTGDESQFAQQSAAYLGGLVKLQLNLFSRMNLVVGGRVGGVLPAVKIYFREENVATMNFPLIEGFIHASIVF